MMALVRLLGLALLFGTGLLGVGALMHPVLQGDATAQLRLIAATPHWREIQLVVLVWALSAGRARLVLADATKRGQ